MRLTVLGSGDAHGIPRAGCACPACTGGVRRGNTCAVVASSAAQVAIDTGCGPRPDLAGLLLTHHHPDHSGRAGEFAGVPLWGPADPELRTPPDMVAVAPFATVVVAGLACTAVPLVHPVPAVGWVLDDGARRLAWLTDTFGLPPASETWLAAHSCDLVAIDCTFPPGTTRAPIKQHGELALVLALLARLRPARALLIHIGHDLECWLADHPGTLPASVAVAHDGMVIDA
jgi:phosphoribosyl 1,2-cyclic phosphate phosphodiesterase